MRRSRWPRGCRRTVAFTVEGKFYECDLCEPHLTVFHEAIRVCPQTRTDAREPGISESCLSERRPRAAADGQPSASEVRDWARSQGLEVSTRGRVPAQLLAAFEAAR